MKFLDFIVRQKIENLIADTFAKTNFNNGYQSQTCRHFTLLVNARLAFTLTCPMANGFLKC